MVPASNDRQSFAGDYEHHLGRRRPAAVPLFAEPTTKITEFEVAAKGLKLPITSLIRRRPRDQNPL
jgi:hypothetical protein